MYHPWDEPLVGRDVIVADWLTDPDEAGSWEADYTPMLLDGHRAVVTGKTRYAEGNTYSNLFLVDFGSEGRCSAFAEWYMRHPVASPVNVGAYELEEDSILLRASASPATAFRPTFLKTPPSRGATKRMIPLNARSAV